MSEQLESGIYCIENLINGKKYIGKAKNIENRFYDHKRKLRTNSHFNIYLQRAWNKYGSENFKFYILEKCSENKIYEKEKYYIKKFETKNKNFGYNLTDGGDGALGAKWTDEQIEKIKGKNHWNFGKPAYNKGIPMTENQIKLLSGENHWDASGKNNPMYGKSGILAPSFGKKMKNASSKYFGVCIKKTDGRIYWMSYTDTNGNRVNIGNFKKEIDAAKAYDKYIIEKNLPNPLNFPK